jgi:hypothetical protein
MKVEPEQRVVDCARALADNVEAREIAERLGAPCYDDMEPEIQAYWLALSRAALTLALGEQS